MRQCIFVIGTRAQLVKIAPVLTLAATSGLDHVVWFTGQHNESIDDLKVDFEIQSPFVYPDKQKEHASVLGLLAWLPGTFFRCRKFIAGAAGSTGAGPLVVVHGDTLSTFVGAAAGRAAGGRIVHLESGLSSEKLFDPFPEEILRRLTFRLTHFALCPNDAAFQRMRGIRGVDARSTGENTLLDCVRFALEKPGDGASTEGHFVASIHRFGNIFRKEALESIVDELIELATVAKLYFVLHPSTERRLRTYGLYRKLEDATGVLLTPRMPYTKFLALLGSARAVFSDGGSNQEELSYLGVPTVLFRERSERPDGIGENIVFRHQIESSLLDFAERGGFDALKRPSRLDDAVYPSRVTVDALLEWAA